MASRFKFHKIENQEGIYRTELKSEFKIKGEVQEGEEEYRISFKILGDEDTKKYKYYKYLNVSKELGVKKLSDAISARKQAIKNVKKGLDPFFKPKALSLDKAVEIYLSHRKSTNNKKDYNIYNKHIKPLIGGIWVQRITIDDVQTVVENMEKNGSAFASIKRALVTPISALNSKHLKNYNPNKLDLKELTYANREKDKPSIDERISTDLKSLARVLYSSISSIEDIEKKLYLLITLMCVRRTGEVNLISYSDIDNNDKTINARYDTTKTSIREMYPISEEITSLLQLHIEKKGLDKNDSIFSYKQRAYSDEFNRIMNDLIETNQVAIKSLYSKYPYGQHDHRTLIATLLNSKYSEDFIGKNILSHKKSSSSDRKYSKATLQFKRDILSEYWEILRGKVDKTSSSKLLNPAMHNETYYNDDKYSLKSEINGNTVLGYYEDTKPMFNIEINEDFKPVKGVWYDENGVENICSNATYRKFGFSIC